jgi:hypothetical protein
MPMQADSYRCLSITDALCGRCAQAMAHCHQTQMRSEWQSGAQPHVNMQVFYMYKLV